ncbi:helix-turn-helix domain-containing protein [Mucilaginibacter psychrotolerans]|uniref:Helix-turn-helix domain-containing protein n=1 Tax=Mucilaginibacter psychrotolerans TaxID=1524096 RepID=A0A4Y8SFF7_9SPHI|nr:helix-turn-helix domain-containing protein [Mucilaginibacter psychrotolerans]
MQRRSSTKRQPIFWISRAYNLGKTYGLSESCLKRDIKSTFNKTVFAYYRHLQMQLADNYLKQKKGNKTQIASLLNFESQSNFLICYKKY